MKTRKFSKIVLLVLSLALLIGSAVGIAVSAEDNSREILSQNIIYSDRLTVMYAVDATLEEAIAGDVRVSYYWEEDGVAELKAAKLLYPYDENNELIAGYVYQPKDGEGNVINTYPVFITEGVPAKDLLKVANVTAYAGELPAAPVYESYSVAEYLYTKLYRDGYIAKTEVDGKDYERKLMYTKLLDYGAQAQTLLVNYDKAEAEREPLVTDCAVAATFSPECTLDGTDTFLFALAGSSFSITPVYSGTGNYLCENWKLIYADGSEQTVASGTAVEVSSQVIFEPILTMPTRVYDFETDPLYSTSTLKINNYSLGSSGTAENDLANYIDSSTAPKFAKGAFLSIAADPATAANKVMKVNVVTTSGADNYRSNISITPYADVADGDLYVLEFDYYYASMSATGTNNYPVMFLLNYEDGSSQNINATYQYKSTGQYRIEANTASTANLNAETWYRIRFVGDKTNSQYSVYLSSDAGASYTLAGTKTADFNGIASIGLKFNVYNITSVQYIDNVTCVQTNAETLGIAE